MPRSDVGKGSKTRHDIAIVFRGGIELPQSIHRRLHRITKNYPLVAGDSPLFPNLS
jgi:hypothetical protein